VINHLKITLKILFSLKKTCCLLFLNHFRSTTSGLVMLPVFLNNICNILGYGDINQVLTYLCISNMMVPGTLLTYILLLQKKVLRFAQYLKLPINVHPVYIIFECREYYLIHPAKEIFRKFPKMVILKNILILPQVFY
jgi:hypothetical protein